MLQVCIYDNASDDETKDVVAELSAKDPRVIYHCHEKNIRSGSNFQYGLTRVVTPFFSFLSDDDVLLPWFSKTAIQAFERYPEGAFFAGSLLYVTEQKKVVKVGISTNAEEMILSPVMAIKKMIEGTFPLWTSVLFRKMVKEEIGLLDLEVGPFDSDFLLRTAARFPGIASNQFCALFLRHASSFSVAPELSFVWPGWQKLIARFMREERLPYHIRLEGERLMLQNVRRMLILVVLTSICKKNFKEAQNAANYLEELCQEKALRYAFLPLIKASCRYAFFQRGFAYLMKSLFSLRNALNTMKWQKKYGNFAQYLE